MLICVVSDSHRIKSDRIVSVAGQQANCLCECNVYLVYRVCVFIFRFIPANLYPKWSFFFSKKKKQISTSILHSNRQKIGAQFQFQSQKRNSISQNWITTFPMPDDRWFERCAHAIRFRMVCGWYCGFTGFWLTREKSAYNFNCHQTQKLQMEPRLN